MKDLLWELFLMVRELEPPTADHTKRQQEWAARFHELEAVADRAQAVDTAGHNDDDDDDDEDPHEHGVPVRARGTRKKR